MWVLVWLPRPTWTSLGLGFRVLGPTCPPLKTRLIWGDYYYYYYYYFILFLYFQTKSSLSTWSGGWESSYLVDPKPNLSTRPLPLLLVPYPTLPYPVLSYPTLDGRYLPIVPPQPALSGAKNKQITHIPLQFMSILNKCGQINK